MPSKTLTCPTCFKTEEDDRANCINRQSNMCPDAVELEQSAVVEVVCAAPCGGPCGKHLAVPIGSVMKRRQLTNLGVCEYDTCRARVVYPQRNAGPSSPPPITQDKRGQGK
jgi:hypothetical protein